MQLRWLSNHAVCRYMERVRSIEIDRDDTRAIERARSDIKRLLPFGRATDSAPAWAGSPRDWWEHFFMLGDDVCFIVANECAVTCLVRGRLSPGTRKRRTLQRRARRYARARARGH